MNRTILYAQKRAELSKQRIEILRARAKKRTAPLRNALIISLLSIFLSLSAATATTYAWFTDTVSNTGNKIQAGTLKIDLLQDKEENHTADSYNSIANQTESIFSDEVIWEPGQTQVAYLAVKNNGNLALKYNIILDVVDRETNKDLTQAMAGAFTYAVINQDTPKSVGDDWPDVKAAAIAPYGYSANLLAAIQEAAPGAKSARITAAPTGKLQPNNKDYFVIAIHMNEDAGNAYQNGLIEFDVNVVATQDTVEKDGFNSEQYDAGAKFDEVAKRIEGKPSYHQTQETINQLSDTSKVELTIIESDNSLTAEVSGKEAKAQLAYILSLIPEEKKGLTTDTTLDLTLNVKTTEAKPEFIALDISMDGVVTTTKKEEGKADVVTKEKVAINNTTDLTVVKLVLEENIKDIKVTHSGVPMNEVASGSTDEGFFFNKSTSTLTIQTKSFSPYTISYTKEYVEPVKPLKLTLKGEGKTIGEIGGKTFIFGLPKNDQIAQGHDSVTLTITEVEESDSAWKITFPKGVKYYDLELDDGYGTVDPSANIYVKDATDVEPGTSTKLNWCGSGYPTSIGGYEGTYFMIGGVYKR